MTTRRTPILSTVLAVIVLGCHSAALTPSSRAISSATCPGSLPPMELTSEGTGEPLAIFGGGLTGAAGVGDLVRSLAADRRVLRLQNLNVAAGLSGVTLPSDYSVRMESCAAVAALVNAGVTEPLDVVGYSYGGLIAIDFALRNPARVKSLTVIEPPAVWMLSAEERSTPELVHFTNTLISVARRRPSDEAVAAFACIVFGCPPGDELRAAPQLPVWNTAVRHRQSLSGLYALTTHRASASELIELRKPILYVSGIGTSRIHGLVNDRFRSARAATQFVDLPGGHAVPNVSSSALADAIRTFTMHVPPSRRVPATRPF